MLHPEAPPRVPFVTRQLEKFTGPVVASTDYVKAYTEQIRPYLPKGRTYKALGTDGWWHFGFQGCTLFATETVALIDPAGGPTGDAFQAPTGYQCRFEIVGTSDATGYATDQLGNVADTGGLIFLESSSSWSSPTTWKITCIQA